MEVVQGLDEVGQAELAAELNWATIKTLHNNCSEFISPSSGTGYGAVRYGLTAAKYLSTVIQHLFGIASMQLKTR